MLKVPKILLMIRIETVRLIENNIYYKFITSNYFIVLYRSMKQRNKQTAEIQEVNFEIKRKIKANIILFENIFLEKLRYFI